MEQKLHAWIAVPRGWRQEVGRSRLAWDAYGDAVSDNMRAKMF